MGQATTGATTVLGDHRHEGSSIFHVCKGNPWRINHSLMQSEEIWDPETASLYFILNNKHAVYNQQQSQLTSSSQPLQASSASVSVQRGARCYSLELSDTVKIQS